MLSTAKQVARHAVSSFDDIALSVSSRGRLAVFSDATGTWVRSLSGPQQNDPQRRLTSRCAGGLAVLAHESLWLACVRPALERAGDAPEGALWLYELDAALHILSEQRIGPVARDGRGVALTASREQLFVAWADGKSGEPAVQLATVPLRARSQQAPPARALSTPGRNGRQPALLWLEPHLYATWSESELAPGGELHRVMIARDTEKPHALLPVRIADPTPRLARDGDSVVMSFRNAPARDARPDLYVARLSQRLAFAAAPRRLGRANGEGAPALALCKSTRAALAPLDHAGELYIAFHPLSPELRSSEANHQYYASGREFVLCAASCQGDGLQALLAERTQPAKPGAELLSVEFRCSH